MSDRICRVRGGCRRPNHLAVGSVVGVDLEDGVGANGIDQAGSGRESTHTKKERKRKREQADQGLRGRRARQGRDSLAQEDTILEISFEVVDGLFGCVANPRLDIFFKTRVCVLSPWVRGERNQRARLEMGGKGPPTHIQPYANRGGGGGGAGGWVRAGKNKN